MDDRDDISELFVDHAGNFCTAGYNDELKSYNTFLITGVGYLGEEMAFFMRIIT